MSTKDTKECLLDVAEELFAEHGYHGTSLRAITNKAGANLAAVNYHFGSKEALIEAVIKRRLLPLNALRAKRLESVRQEARQRKRLPRVQDVLRAFIEPTLLFRESSAGAKSFVTLVARSLVEPNDTVRKIFLRQVMPVFEMWHDLLAEALPDMPRDILHFRLHFTIGALGHTMHLDDNWPVERHECDDGYGCTAASLVEMFVPFVTAGMEAP